MKKYYHLSNDDLSKILIEYFSNDDEEVAKIDFKIADLNIIIIEMKERKDGSKS